MIYRYANKDLAPATNLQFEVLKLKLIMRKVMIERFIMMRRMIILKKSLIAVMDMFVV